MSETTKRTLGADMIDLSVPWAKRIDPTHLAARPVDQQALRASRLGAEGGEDRETTNSPAEIGRGCTGRKIDPSPWFTIPLLLVSVVGFWCEIVGVPEIGLACFGLFAAFCGIGAASGFFSVVRGGEGV